MPDQPYIVNIFPKPGSLHAKVLSSIRLTVRDVDTVIDPTSLNVDVGYAKVFADGVESFETALPRTKLSSIFSDPPDGDASITVNVDGVVVEKTSTAVQRSVFFTAIDVGSRIKSGLISAVLKVGPQDTGGVGQGPLNQSIMPGNLPVPYTSGGGFSVTGIGAVLGLESGARHSGAYLFFVNIGTSGSPVRVLRLAGPDVGGVRVPDVTIPFDWSSVDRYFLLWNEATGNVELFVDINGVTTKLASSPISGFQQFGSAGTPQRGGSTDIVGIYGQEGPVGNKVTIEHVAVTGDVGFPFLGGAVPGEFVAFRKSAEVVGFTLDDPRALDVAPWFDTDSSILPSPDPTGIKKGLKNGVFRLTKNTLGTTFGVYREEPGFHHSDTDGFEFETTFFGIPSQRAEVGTGMGFIVFDGTTVFQFDLLDDTNQRNVGLLRKNGDPNKALNHFLPSTPVDWASSVAMRVVVDPRRGKIEFFLVSDIRNPVLSIPLDRTKLPSAADFGWTNKPVFIAFGFITPTNTLGSMEVHSLNYSHLYQMWEARDALLPNSVSANPRYTKSGGGAASFVDGLLQLSSTPGQQLIYQRQAVMDPFRGAIVEARMRISSFKPRSRTGTYLVLDDGVTAFMLSFVDADDGKYACLALNQGFFDFGEKVGLAGLGRQVSFPIDWTQFHIYRMERRPLDGTYIFVDQETKPRLIVRDSDRVNLATTRFPTTFLTPETVAFGQFKLEGSTSIWDYVRHTFSSGFELSAHKFGNKDVLIDELSGTEALVIAYADDEDA